MSKRAILGIDLGFGDAGKGSITDFLVRETKADWVVRYNGGAQAAHHVVSTDGREHTFSQFGSGMFVLGTKSFLTEFMMINPLNMMNEERHLRELRINDCFERTVIDGRALIITPYQVAVNRLRESSRGDNCHGSCGMGIGETKSDFLTHGDKTIFASDLRNPEILRKKLSFLSAIKQEEMGSFLGNVPDNDMTRKEIARFHDPSYMDYLIERYLDFSRIVSIVEPDFWPRLLEVDCTMIFEGAQGVLLDEWYGFHPYTTWSSTTFENANCLLADYEGEVCRLGITRGYNTRHGPGPFPTWDKDLTAKLPDSHNHTNLWQKDFRVGWLDMVLLKYALDVIGGVDVLAVTCLDRMDSFPIIQAATHYTAPQVPRIRTDQITFQMERDLDHQEIVGSLLGVVKPSFSSFSSTHELIQFIENELSIPVGITSFGPTATDKFVHHDWLTPVCV